MAARVRAKSPRKGFPETESSVIIELQRATHAAGVQLEEVLADLDLSQGEAHVIVLLSDGAAHTVSELQRDLGHRPSTLSGILDRLESRRLIRRALNEADRRSFLISLTRSGGVAARTVVKEMRAIELSALAHVSARDIAGFHAVAQALVARSDTSRPP
ncbi:MAG: MarR family transcriptional regulator [Acetobacteraceae bacterium]|nr:MarR family transcriptional regulator [Acetobacteraceae bacterium]